MTAIAASLGALAAPAAAVARADDAVVVQTIPDEQEALRELLRSAVQRALAAHALTTEYEVEVFSTITGSPRPTGAATGALQSLRTQRYAAATADGRLRIDRAEAMTGTLVAPEASIEFELRPRRAMWRVGPHDPHEDASSIFHAVDGFSSFGGFRRLVDEVSEAVIDEVRHEGSIVTVRYRLPRLDEAESAVREHRGAAAPIGPFRHELIVDVAGPRVVGTGRFFPTSDDPECEAAIAGEGGRGIRLRVEEWMEFNGRPLPQRLTRTVWGPAGRSEERFRRISVQPLESAERAAIMEVLRDGWTVFDPHLGLEFTIGSRTLRWQGRTWTLAEPIRTHPGNRLDELIATAVAAGG